MANLNFVVLGWAVFFSLMLGYEPILPKFRFGNKTSSVELADSNSFLVLGQQLTEFNGTLKLSDDNQGRISGQGIVFQDGILATRDVAERDITVSGTYTTATGEEITLQNNGIFNVSVKKTINKKIKIPASTSASILGSPVFSQTIELADQTSELKLGIQSPLNKDILLNGGTITLQDNLIKTADSIFLGSGTINIDNYRLILSGGQISTGKITLVNAQDLSLTSNLVINSEINFNQSGSKPSVFSCDGFMLTFQSGGFLSVNSAQQIIFADAFIKGFGNYPSYGFFTLSPTATVVFQNTTIELTGDYTHSNGTFLFKGDRCKIIPNGHSFTTTGTAAWICVDGVGLEYDSLAGVDSNPFIFTAESAQKQLLNGATIKSCNTQSTLNISNYSISMRSDYLLANDSKINILNSVPSSPKIVSMDWAGYTITFPSTGSNLLNLDPHVNLVLSNAVLSGFNKDLISYGDSNASLAFGTGNQLRLFDDISISNLDKVWTFSGSNQIIGSGSFITWTGSKSIAVQDSSTLTIKDLWLKGLGPSGSAGYFDINPTGTVIFQNCTLELSGNYSHTSGTFEFKEGCKIIHHGFNFNTTGLAFLRVNSSALEYESLSGTDANPFVFSDESSQKKLINGGVIRSTVPAANVPGQTSIFINNTPTSIDLDFTLSSGSTITFVNETPTTPKPMSLSFSGQNLYFPNQGSDLFNIGSNIGLTTNNIVLFNFNKDVVSYGDSNASLTFGSGTQIRLFDDVSITNSDKPWNFTGNGQICGCGTTLTLNGSNRLTVNASSSLKLINLRIFCKNIDSLACLDSTSKIIFENCTLVLDKNGIDFSQGNIDVNGFLEVVGGDATTIETISKLTFSSAGLFKVLSQSKMKINKGIEFVYKANPTNNGTNTSATKRHFLLVDPTATLQLDGAVLHSTSTAFALDYGRLIIDDTVNFVIDGVGAESAEIGSAVELCIKSGATFEVDGIIKYISSSF